MGCSCSCFGGIGDDNNNNNKKRRIKLDIFKKTLCKINLKDSGILCKIPLNKHNKLLPVLITNQNILNKNDILPNKNIKLFINQKEYIILIDKSRFIYNNDNNNYNIVIIEIKEDDGVDLNSFLEIEKDIEKLPKTEASLIYFSQGNNINHCKCVIQNVKEHIISYKCNETLNNLYFSPIVNINNHKLIGITELKKKNNSYSGTLILNLIKEISKTIDERNKYDIQNNSKIKNGQDSLNDTLVNISQNKMNINKDAKKVNSNKKNDSNILKKNIIKNNSNIKEAEPEPNEQQYSKIEGNKKEITEQNKSKIEENNNEQNNSKREENKNVELNKQKNSITESNNKNTSKIQEQESSKLNNSKIEVTSNILKIEPNEQNNLKIKEKKMKIFLIFKK